ncbi:MAG TPA: carboxypeptidase-like regulatory domain-containing protein [Terriglobales bacterium]|nr:carboxypeptidase-like regulatory domain-containing protein [Terriglobales bacterium]
MFEWFALRVRRSLSIGILLSVVVAALAVSLWAQEETVENPTTGTIQGTVRDDDGKPLEGAKVFYNSSATDAKGFAVAGKDGVYVTEPLPAGLYVVRAQARDKVPVDRNVTVVIATAVTADFRLEWINPGPMHLQSTFSGDAPNTLPIDGRNYLAAGELEPGVQSVDGRALDPGKGGFQTLSINSQTGRTTHYDADEVEVMDETKGLATENFPAEAVREVVVSRATPEVFQSLNAVGAVRIATRSAGENWHGNLFGNLQDKSLGLAGFPSGGDGYSRQQFGFGAGGAVIKDKAFLFVAGERSKQDGGLPIFLGFPCSGIYLSGLCGTTSADQISLRSAFFRENMLTARFDYNVSENMKWFARLSYDNANQIGPPDSQSNFRNQLNVPAAVGGVDWNHGEYTNSARFGYQKMVNSVTPALGDSLIVPGAPFHMTIGSYQLGPTVAGPRQTIQRDIFGRYDSSTVYKIYHTIRFGGVIHRITQGDFFAPGNYGPSVTSSNGIDEINAINSDASLAPLIPNDPRGAADNPLNYPVGTITIFNGLGNFSENSAFNRSTGGHADTRIEGYFGDTYNVIPNLNVYIGLNYVRDSGRTDSDLGAIPCSAINTTIVTAPPCTTGYILDQFALFPNPVVPGNHQVVSPSIKQPNFNLAPQFGFAWDPGHNGHTVIRVSTGMFYDNFLLQNTYQDRINRLSNGQYNRSLQLCPAGSVLFPNGSLLSSVTVPSSGQTLDIASQICGQPIGQVASAIQALQNDFLSAQSGVTGGPNVYSLANSVSNFGGLLAPNFRTPRVIHIAAGIQHQMGERGMFSADYVREIGTQFPIGIDTNHVGDSRYLTDGYNLNPLQNTFAAELSAISNTVASVGCGPALSTGGSSQAAVTCYLNAVPTATIADFARNGLDSANAFCGPFPCSVLGKQQAAFGGINPTVGSNLMYFPGGRSRYSGLHLAYHVTTADNPWRDVKHLEVSVAYTLSRYRTNVAEPNGSGGDYSTLTPAEDYNKPHLGHWGASGFDRTHQFTLTPTADLAYKFRLSMIAHVASPLPLSAYIPQQDGGGVPGEIFRSDISGDGTVGDLLPSTIIGSTGKYSNSNLTKAIKYYDTNYAGQLTPAGNTLVTNQLFSALQLHQLGAYAPVIQPIPGRAAQATWLKTMDLRLSRPLQVTERVVLEPNISVFNIFNWANFGGPGGQLNGILDGAPGTSLNNATSGGYCGPSNNLCTQRLDRVLPGSGTFSYGAPRQLEFGLRVNF